MSLIFSSRERLARSSMRRPKRGCEAMHREGGGARPQQAINVTFHLFGMLESLFLLVSFVNVRFIERKKCVTRYFLRRCLDDRFLPFCKAL